MSSLIGAIDVTNDLSLPQTSGDPFCRHRDDGMVRVKSPMADKKNHLGRFTYLFCP